MSLVENGVVKAERLRALWLARERSSFHIHDSKNDLEEVDSGRDGGQTAVSRSALLQTMGNELFLVLERYSVDWC